MVNEPILTGLYFHEDKSRTGWWARSSVREPSAGRAVAWVDFSISPMVADENGTGAGLWGLKVVKHGWNYDLVFVAAEMACVMVRWDGKLP